MHASTGVFRKAPFISHDNKTRENEKMQYPCSYQSVNQFI